MDNNIHKKVLKGNNILQNVCHSLESFNHVKLEGFNFIEFDCVDPENLIIGVKQKQTVQGFIGEETFFEDIYNIKINNPTLRELLLI